MSEFQQIQYQRDQAVALITLNRPDKRNALSDVLISELIVALKQADHDNEVKVILLQGAGQDFCAGADLAKLEKIAQQSVLEHLDDAQALATMFETPRSLSKPVIAAVHGRAFAGGAGLATACDIVLAADTAQFAYTEVKIGFVAAIVMAFLKRSLGEKRALELLLTGKSITATEAERIGLINHVFAESEFAVKSLAFAHEIAALSASAVMLTKRLLYQTDGMSFAQSLQAGAEMNAIARLTPDCQAGVQKFLQRK